MTWDLYDNILFYGKIGADNLLLILVGVLHLLIWLKRRKDGLRRIRQELCEAIFFIGYGLAIDLYRYQFLRKHLVLSGNFTIYKITILIALLTPLYIQLIGDVKRLYFGGER